MSGEEFDVPKPPLPISSEYDHIKETFFSKTPVDRSEWRQRALSERPDIRDFRERVNPVARAAKFAQLYLPENRLLDHETLLSLISHHLRTLGLVESESSLHSEWDRPFEMPAHLQRSQLNYLIQRGIFRTERFWELTLACPNLTDEQRKRLLDEEISRTIGGAPTIPDDTKPLAEEVLNAKGSVVINEEGVLKQASLNQLILLLTTDTSGDMSRVASAFCLTYKSFVSSRVLFSKFRERFRMTIKNKEKQNAALTMKLFKKWIKKASNEIEQPVIEAIKVFAEKELHQHFPKEVGTLFEQSESQRDVFLVDWTHAPAVNLGRCATLWTGTFSLFDLPPEEIARQMTYWSCVRYYAIKKSELLNGSWMNPRLKHRSPNVVALTYHTNAIVNWMSYSILNEKKLERRLEVWSYLVSVLRCLWDLQNYCDAFAFLGGFDSDSINRLSVHRGLLNRRDADFMDKVNMQTYLEGGSSCPKIRQLHKDALASKKPVLPYFGIYLGDLCRYGEAVKNTIDGLINVTKCTKTFEFIKSFEEFKYTKYCFLPIEQVQERLEFAMFNDYDQDTLMAMSFDVEPEGSSEASLRARG